MKTFYWNFIQTMMDALKANPKVTVKHITTPLPLNKREKQAVKDVTPGSIFEFHEELNGFELQWVGKDIKDPEVKGSVKILPAQEILRNWEGVVYFDFTPADDRIRNFHPLDFFIDEACVGAFLNEAGKEDTSLYFFQFEGEPAKLNLDVNGYIQMMSASKGFLYWQYAVIEILEGKENPTSQRFKEWMPKLFTDFSWEEYLQLYNKLKMIDK
jgi:hypothetical protein